MRDQRASVFDLIIGRITQFTTITQLLLIANFLVYAIQIVIQSTLGNFDVFEIFARASAELGSTGFSSGQALMNEMCQYVPFECTFGVASPLLFPEVIWQVFTSMFLHGGLFHLGINMLILWQFGQVLERVWGSTYFLKYYLFAGIGSGFCVVLMALITADPFAYGVTLGASGAIFGLLLAFGMHFPRERLYLFFAIPVEARFAVIIFAGATLLFLVSGAMPGISHVGHLGGLIFGLIYLKGPALLRKL